MKLAIERAALLKSLAHVQSVVERRTTIPILSNVRLEASDGALGLTATDSTFRWSSQPRPRSPSRAPRPRPRTPCTTSCASCPKAPGGDRAQRDSGAEITLRAGRQHLRSALPAGRRLPDHDRRGSRPQLRPAAGELRRLIDRTRFAISTEETRYYLNGIFLHALDDGAARLRTVATDGHRLARVEVALPEGAAGMPPVIVPRKTVGELRKLIDEPDAEAAVEIRALQRPHPFRGRSGGAALAPDRRHVSRLRAGHPDRQRQAAGRADQGAVRRRSTGSRPSRPTARARSSSASPGAG